MTSASSHHRNPLRGAAIAATLLSAVMLLLTAGAIAPGLPFDPVGVDAAPAGTAPVGPLTLSPESGNSDQQFAVGPSPLPATCPGDSANDGFAVNTFMTPVANDPATLTYNAAGPVGPGFTQPLFDRFDTPIINKNTAPDTGLILSIGPARFSAFGPGGVPAGRYFVGLACTKAGATESFWSSTIEVTADAVNGGSGEIRVALVESTPASTTTTTVPQGSTTTTTVAGATTTTTVAGATTTTTVAGATTTTTVAGGAQAATLSPAIPTPGGSYRVTHPNCRVGDTITVSQPQSTPTSQTATCAVPVAGLVRPQQAPTVGTATATFTAAPTAAGSYTVTSSGPNSGTRTATFTITATTTNPGASAGGSPASSSTGTIPSTGSSTTSLIVWGLLLLVFGRIAILLGRKPKVLSGT